jgi:hypothetical protein
VKHKRIDGMDSNSHGEVCCSEIAYLHQYGFITSENESESEQIYQTSKLTLKSAQPFLISFSVSG